MVHPLIGGDARLLRVPLFRQRETDWISGSTATTGVYPRGALIVHYPPTTWTSPPSGLAPVER